MQWENGPEGGCPVPPFPQQPSRPPRDRAPPGPPHDCPPFLFLVLLSFSGKLCPRPRGPALTAAPKCRWARPGAFVSAALRVAANSALADGQRGRGRRGGGSGAGHPLCVPDRCLSPPRGPGGRGRGMGALRLPWRGPGARNRGPGIAPEPAAERGGDGQGSGRGAGGRGGGGRALPGAASRLFPPSRPSRRRAHCLRPGSSRSRRSPAGGPPQTRGALPGLGEGRGPATPAPSGDRGGLDPRPGPSPQPLPPGAPFPEPPVRDGAPGPPGMEVCVLAGHRAGYTESNLGRGKIDFLPHPPRAARRESRF